MDCGSANMTWDVTDCLWCLTSRFPAGQCLIWLRSIPVSWRSACSIGSLLPLVRRAAPSVWCAPWWLCPTSPMYPPSPSGTEMVHLVFLSSINKSVSMPTVLIFVVFSYYSPKLPQRPEDVLLVHCIFGSNLTVFTFIFWQTNFWNQVSWWRCLWVEPQPVWPCPTWPRMMRASTPSAFLQKTALPSIAPTCLSQVGHK